MYIKEIEKDGNRESLEVTCDYFRTIFDTQYNISYKTPVFMFTMFAAERKDKNIYF